MKRTTSGREGEKTLESRFAALTSGLLARKGQALPSNSPIADPAEETEAFTLDTALIPRKGKPQIVAAPPKPAPQKPAAAAAQAKAAPVPTTVPTTAPTPAPQAKPAALAPAPKPAMVAPAIKPAVAPPPAMNIINEKGEGAFYLDNPSPEEIAALDAEANEVLSYFENFGSPDAAAREKNEFLGPGALKPSAPPQGPSPENAGAVDFANDFADEEDSGANDRKRAAETGAETPNAPEARAEAALEPVRAGVTVQLTAREFMRLTLGAAELDLSAQELMAEAIEEYLDARGVESLGGCACLQKAQKF